MIHSYMDKPCERCGSKRRETQRHTEVIEMILRSSVIKVSQIVCTNSECQKAFDKNRAEELTRINERRRLKEEQDKARKDSLLLRIAEGQKIKLKPKLKH